MDNEKVPEWAKARAVALSESEGEAWGEINPRYPSVVAFARYIAEHEEPPVDPLLVEARKFACTCSHRWSHEEIMAGTKDETPALRDILRALRRGIELARKEDSHAG